MSDPKPRTLLVNTLFPEEPVTLLRHEAAALLAAIAAALLSMLAMCASM